MSTFYVAGIAYSDDDIRHFGIPGMKWGVRHDYVPVGRGGKGSSVQSSNDQRNSQQDYDRIQRRNQKLKTAVKVGAAVAITGLAVYGAYKLKNSGALNGISGSLGESVNNGPVASSDLGDDGELDIVQFRLKEDGGWYDPSQAIKDYFKNRENEKVDNETGLHLKDELGSIEDDLRSVNPEFKGENISRFSDTLGYLAGTNCGLCSTTYDLRRRGYDVIAGYSNKPLNFSTLSKMYKGSEVLQVSKNGFRDSMLSARPPMEKSDIKSTISNISKYGQSRGIVGVSWGNCVSGHYMSFEVDSQGNVSFLDGQRNKIIKGNELEELLESCSAVECMRTDNLEPNIDEIRKAGFIR